MTPAQLIALAKQIYPERGDNWKTPLACDKVSAHWQYE